MLSFSNSSKISWWHLKQLTTTNTRKQTLLKTVSPSLHCCCAVINTSTSWSEINQHVQVHYTVSLLINTSISWSELNHKTLVLSEVHYRVLLTDMQLPRCFVCVQTLPVNCSFIDGTTDSRIYCTTHNTQQQFNNGLMALYPGQPAWATIRGTCQKH